MTETDLEYLLRTLSEARSRANEISVAVNSRVGGGHRLSELGNSAVSQIENLLRQIRRAASDEPVTGLTEDALASKPFEAARAAPRKEPAQSSLPPTLDPASQHWFHEFVNELLEDFLVSSEISFETVERALAKRKEAFLEDLEVTRRMYRTYPQLFPEIETHAKT